MFNLLWIFLQIFPVGNWSGKSSCLSENECFSERTVILNLGRTSLCCFSPSIFLNGGNDSKKGEWEPWNADMESGKIWLFLKTGNISPSSKWLSIQISTYCEHTSCYFLLGKKTKRVLLSLLFFPQKTEMWQSPRTLR